MPSVCLLPLYCESNFLPLHFRKSGELRGLRLHAYVIHLGGHVQMTSVLRGRGGLPISDDKRGGCVISILKILGGVKNPENYADVICTWPLIPE